MIVIQILGWVLNVTLVTVWVTLKAYLLPALQPDIIPVAGSRADLALDLAADLLQRSGMARGEILLVTDSADSRDAAKARELRDDGIITSVKVPAVTKERVTDPAHEAATQAGRPDPKTLGTRWSN